MKLPMQAKAIERRKSEKVKDAVVPAGDAVGQSGFLGDLVRDHLGNTAGNIWDAIF